MSIGNNEKCNIRSFFLYDHTGSHCKYLSCFVELRLLLWDLRYKEVRRPGTTLTRLDRILLSVGIGLFSISLPRESVWDLSEGSEVGTVQITEVTEM